MKRFIAIITVVFILCSLIGGCGKKDSKTQSAGQNVSETTKDSEQGKSNEPDQGKGVFPITKEKVTLRVMRQLSPYNGQWNDLTMMKWMEEKTNVHWEEISAVEGFEEKKNIAIASGDLPDVFFMCTTAAEEDKYGPEGTFIALDDLINQYGPNIKKQLEKHPGLKKATTALDGKIYSLGTVCSTVTMGSYKMHINMKWLENLGLPKPKTVDDLYNVLKAFRDKDPNRNGQNDEIPFSDRAFWGVDPTMMAYFGEPAPGLVNIKNGKVNFAFTSEGYKAYLEFMAKLYKEKLLDNECFTMTDEQLTAKLKENRVGFSFQAYLGDWKQFQVQEPLTSPYTSKPIAIPVDKYYTGGVVITKACKHPDVVIKWFDIFFRDEEDIIEGCYGPSLNYGRKGIEWDYLDPEKKTWDYLFEFPEGENSYLIAIKKHVLGWSPGMIINMALPNDPYQAWVGNDNMNYYYPYMNESMYYPSTVRYTDAESKKLSILETDLRTYIDEFKAKVITGQESLSNWDKYVNQLKTLGVDEYVQIKQAAYDRYNAIK